jgi:hypothetical protein
MYEQTIIDDRKPVLNLCKSVVRNANGTRMTYDEARKAIAVLVSPIEHDRAKLRKAKAQAAMDMMVKNAAQSEFACTKL